MINTNVTITVNSVGEIIHDNPVMECVGQVVIRISNLIKKNNFVTMAVMCLFLFCTLQGCISTTERRANPANEEQISNTENTDDLTRQDTKIEQEETESDEMKEIILTVNDQVLTAKLVDNSSTNALIELLQEGPLSIQMSDYGNMEKVGDIGTSLPSNNERITTEAGDLILYMGNSFVIYYAPNSWNLTRLGKIQDVTAADLKKILGDGDVIVTLSLTE